MGNFKFYVAAMAIACMTLLQDVSGEGCSERLAEVWDNTFQEERTLNFMEDLFATAKELGTNEVCSDTSRALAEFIKVEATDRNAQYSNDMFTKMILALLTEASEKTTQYTETKKVIERILNDQNVQKLVLDAIVRSANLLVVPDHRTRLVKMLKVLEKILVPSTSEMKVKRAMSNFMTPLKFFKTHELVSGVSI